jgi:DNA-binding protein Fis
MEKNHLLQVLNIAGGNKSRTASLLGISRPRLHRLLAKYGIE